VCHVVAVLREAHPVSRTQGLIVLLLLIAVGSGTAWFLNNFEEVTENVHTGYRGEARINPWLAAQRLLARMGAQATTMRSVPELRNLAPSATLLLPARRHTLTSSLRQSVLDWVDRGGHLIVEAEPAALPDPLLDAIGVRRSAVKRPKDAARCESSEPFEIVLPGRETGSLVRLSRGMRLDAPDAEFAFDGGPGNSLLMLRRGEGEITVVNELDFASNAQIGNEQHARFLWDLVSAQSGDGQVYFFNRPGKLSLTGWLQENAWAPLAGAALLLLFWLWYVAPRMGPVAPDPERNRRRLLDHLRASGRFLWSNGGAQRMLDAAREACLRRIARAYPDVLAVTESERPQRLAEVLGWPEARTRQLLAPAVPAKMMDFLQTIGLYQAVHEQLALNARASSRKT